MTDPDNYTLFEEASVRFIRAVRGKHGGQTAADVLAAVRGVLGQEWGSNITYNLVAGNHTYMEQIRISVAQPTPHGFKFINAIKEVRAISGVGLGEAKTIVERARDGAPQTIRLLERPDWNEKRFTSAIQELRMCHVEVEVS